MFTRLCLSNYRVARRKTQFFLRIYWNTWISKSNFQTIYRWWVFFLFFKQNILICLNNSHHAIKFLFKKVKIIAGNHSPIYQVFNVLDTSVIYTQISNTFMYTITFHITVHILNILRANSHVTLLKILLLFLII